MFLSLTQYPRNVLYYAYRLGDDEDGDDDLIVLAPSEESHSSSRRHISVASGSRTPSDASVVDLTNDSGMEDEDVIDLTTSFQVCVQQYPPPPPMQYSVNELVNTVFGVKYAASLSLFISLLLYYINEYCHGILLTAADAYNRYIRCGKSPWGFPSDLLPFHLV